MATNEDRGMTGRDVIAKTFTVVRKGYEPVQVDTYLEQVGDQIDTLRAKIEHLEAEVVSVRAEKDAAMREAQTTVSELAPPPPAAAAVAESATSGEAADIVLRMAHETSERAISEAQKRAAEIEADAEFKAAEMQRESDRKAFEAASRSQGELRSIQGEIDERRMVLNNVGDEVREQQSRLRVIADKINAIADETVLAESVNGSENGATIDLSEDTLTDEPATNDAATNDAADSVGEVSAN